MLKNTDKEIFDLIEKERKRQNDFIELIASENYVTTSLLEAQGSILTNKYAEGYPNKRYYGGCFCVDEIETLAIERAKSLFSASFCNVQPHSGSQANMACYRALLEKGDTVLGMALDQGGHLTHGSALSFSGIDYNFVPYYVSKETEEIDYEALKNLTLSLKPKMIVAGFSSYPFQIDFKKFREIADLVNAYLMVDMAHIAGLVAAKLHQNPIDYADVVSSTTHKTLRGPRGGIILTNSEEIITKINKVVFPGIQGGPLMHVIAAKAVCFKEASSEEFVSYQKQVLKNCSILAKTLKELGYKVIGNRTENHLCIVDVNTSIGITGKTAENVLDSVCITVNKNTVPFDPLKPFIASGIRLGTAFVTTRGFKEKEIIEVACLIDKALRNYENEEILNEVKESVLNLTQKFPLN